MNPVPNPVATPKRWHDAIQGIKFNVVIDLLTIPTSLVEPYSTIFKSWVDDPLPCQSHVMEYGTMDELAQKWLPKAKNL